MKCYDKERLAGEMLENRCVGFAEDLDEVIKFKRLNVLGKKVSKTLAYDLSSMQTDGLYS